MNFIGLKFLTHEKYFTAHYHLVLGPRPRGPNDQALWLLRMTFINLREAITQQIENIL
jgi:hypothetical protein